MRPLSPEDPADPPWALALHSFLGSLHPTLEDNLAEELHGPLGLGVVEVGEPYTNSSLIERIYRDDRGIDMYHSS